MVQNAKLDSVELERERTVILDELALRKNDWRRLAADALYRAAFPGCATGGPVAGDSESVLKLTRVSIERFYRRRYRPEFCTLVIIGSVNSEFANKAALTAFGAWSSPMLDAESQPAEEKVAAKMAIHAQMPESVAALSVPLPSERSIEASIAASILGIVVGDSRNGRIAEPLRKLDRASTAGWEVPTGNMSGLLMFLAKSSTLRASDMVRTLEVELDRALKEGVTESEVDWARRRLIGAYLFDVETYSGQARQVGSTHLSYGYLSAVNYIDLVRGVSAERVNDFIRQSLTKERRISVTSKAP